MILFLICRCHSTSYVIHGLEPERTYQFRVRATNCHGFSQPSSPSDPIFFQPMTSAASSSLSSTGIVGAHKERPTSLGDEDEEVDEDCFAPQFEHSQVQVQHPGEPAFQVTSN